MEAFASIPPWLDTPEPGYLNGDLERAAWGQEIISIPALHTMFCPHYRRYHGNTTEIVPITVVINANL